MSGRVKQHPIYRETCPEETAPYISGSTLPPILTSAQPPSHVWEVVRTVAAPPSIVVKCGGWFFMWPFVVLLLSCVCVCDLFLQRNLLAWPHRRRGLASDGVRYADARSSVGGRFRSVTKLRLEWYGGVF